MNENYKNKIASLLTNSENIASKRIEYLINYKGQSEFMAPYYSLSNEINHNIDEHIAKHEGSHFGLLGTVNDILN